MKIYEDASGQSGKYYSNITITVPVRCGPRYSLWKVASGSKYASGQKYHRSRTSWPEILRIWRARSKQIQAEVFDTRTRTWEVVPGPRLIMPYTWMSVTNPSLDRKVYVRKKEQVIGYEYDPRDGKCEKILHQKI